MILLFSNVQDKSTALIASWLRYLDAPFVFLREEDLYRDSALDIKRNILSVNGQEYPLICFRSVWVRRPFSFHMTDLCQYIQNEVDVDLSILLREETATITRYIYDFLKDNSTYFLANSSWNGTNKLKELRVAREVGLNVPETIVTTRKSEIVAFYNQYECIISKSLYNARVIHPWDIQYSMYTSRISSEDLEAIPESFAPSLIQEEIIREYDIRTFFLDGDLFSMAILPNSQIEEVDCRNYKPLEMRLLPIQLDECVNDYIRLFMSKMDLKIGSIDLMKGKDGRIYFIEVNHEGQFNMVDKPCNYGIHKIIAERLMRNDIV